MIKALLFGLAAGSAALFFASPAAAQSTGFQGFLQRAGSAVSQTASNVLGNHQGVGNAGGGATTSGATFRPISPATGGQFTGLFNNWHSGDAWPRASIYFTAWGPNLPCWTARATIWRSVREHVEETFQVCNAPLFIHDDMGGSMQLSATHTTDNVVMKMDGAVNIQGISHADTANERNAGPNPPHSLFALSSSGIPASCSRERANRSWLARMHLRHRRSNRTAFYPRRAPQIPAT
jgi:hypothetical protein